MRSAPVSGSAPTSLFSATPSAAASPRVLRADGDPAPPLRFPQAGRAGRPNHLARRATPPPRSRERGHVPARPPDPDRIGRVGIPHRAKLMRRGRVWPSSNARPSRSTSAALHAHLFRNARIRRPLPGSLRIPALPSPNARLSRSTRTAPKHRVAVRTDRQRAAEPRCALAADRTATQTYAAATRRSARPPALRPTTAQLCTRNGNARGG